MSLLAFDKGSKGPSPSNPNDEAQSIRTPSPYQVVSDLIDATCHEILSLQGDEGTDSIPSVSSFTVLAQRLDYYLEQLSNTVPLLEDLNVSTRLLLAKLVLDVCVRSSYPPDDDDKIAEITSQQMYPLIAMTEEEWEGLRRELGMVHSNISSMESADSASLDSLICQVQALEALAKLRSQHQMKLQMILVLKLFFYCSEHLEYSALSLKNPNTEILFHELHRRTSTYLQTKENRCFRGMDRTIIASFH